MPLFSASASRQAAGVIDQAAIASLAAGLGPFVPAEERFGHWKTVRVIDTLVPPSLSFTSVRLLPLREQQFLSQKNTNAISVDDRWLTKILLLTPPEYEKEMRASLDDAGAAITAFTRALNLKEDLRDALSRPISPHSVADANAVLADRERLCALLGLPLPFDLVRHGLGLRAVARPAPRAAASWSYFFRSGSITGAKRDSS